MQNFSRTWKSSKKPTKQIKYRLKSQLHIKQKFVHAHLSKGLRTKYGKRNIGLRKGDKVRIMRGKFKKYENKIEKVDLKKTRVFVSGVEIAKKDGSKKLLAIHPSNLMITELNLDDKLRQKALEGR